MFQHRKFTVGFSYYNPCIYNGPQDLNKSMFMFTVGLNFNFDSKWDGWGDVGKGILATAQLANQVIANYNNTTTTTTIASSSTAYSLPESQTSPTNYSYESNSATSQEDRERAVREEKQRQKAEEKAAKEEQHQYKIMSRSYSATEDNMAHIEGMPDKDLGTYECRLWHDFQKKLKDTRTTFNSKSKNYKIHQSVYESRRCPVCGH